MTTVLIFLINHAWPLVISEQYLSDTILENKALASWRIKKKLEEKEVGWPIIEFIHSYLGKRCDERNYDLMWKQQMPMFAYLITNSMLGIFTLAKPYFPQSAAWHSW